MLADSRDYWKYGTSSLLQTGYESQPWAVRLVPQPGRWWVVPWQVTSLRSLLAWCSQLLKDLRNINARATHSHSFALLLNIFLNFLPCTRSSFIKFLLLWPLCCLTIAPRTQALWQLPKVPASNRCRERLSVHTSELHLTPPYPSSLSLPPLCTSPIHDPHLPSPTSSSFRCFGLKSGPRANTALDGTSSAIPSCSACVNEK